VFEELQALLLRSKVPMATIAAETELSVSLLRGIKTGEKSNPTINTYKVLKAFLEEAEAAERHAARRQAA
jgi:hypothetical protein